MVHVSLAQIGHSDLKAACKTIWMSPSSFRVNTSDSSAFLRKSKLSSQTARFQLSLGWKQRLPMGLKLIAFQWRGNTWTNHSSKSKSCFILIINRGSTDFHHSSSVFSAHQFKKKQELKLLAPFGSILNQTDFRSQMKAEVRLSHLE